MRDIASNIRVRHIIETASVAATDVSAEVDLLGFDSAALSIQTGESTGDFTPVLQESDTGETGDYTDVAAEHLVGTLPETLLGESVYKQGYTGCKRYLRLQLTKTGGTAIFISAVIVMGRPRLAPVL
jgi:hypothetical protein